MEKPVCAVKTTRSFNPKPFIKDGSFVRVRKGSKERGIHEWAMVIGYRIIYQNEGWDWLKDVLPDENKENSYVVDRVYECAFGFDALENCTPVWEFKEKKDMPELKTGMFIADVVNVRADDRNLNPETGKLELAEANPLVYVHGGYYNLGEKIGKFGWSVEKKKS